MSADYTFHAFICVRDLSELKQRLVGYFPSQEYVIFCKNQERNAEGGTKRVQKIDLRLDIC